MEKATFAAGCFWGVEAAFRQVSGVTDAIVGYTGGQTEGPDYKKVCQGNTGHAEAVLVTYDSETVSYQELLDLFWTTHNPTTLNRQGPDVGSQYRSAIFFHNERQEMAANDSKAELEKSERFPNPIVTEIVPTGVFYEAEEYHQRYFEKNGVAHCKI